MNYSNMRRKVDIIWIKGGLDYILYASHSDRVTRLSGTWTITDQQNSYRDKRMVLIINYHLN